MKNFVISSCSKKRIRCEEDTDLYEEDTPSKRKKHEGKKLLPDLLGENLEWCLDCAMAPDKIDKIGDEDQYVENCPAC